MNLSDFDDPILSERNGRKPVYMDRFLVSEFIKFCRTQKKRSSLRCGVPIKTRYSHC